MDLELLMELSSRSMRALHGVPVSLLSQCHWGVGGGSYSELSSVSISGDSGEYHMSCHGGLIRHHHVQIPSVAAPHPQCRHGALRRWRACLHLDPNDCCSFSSSVGVA